MPHRTHATLYVILTFSASKSAGSFPNVASNTLCEGLYDFHNFTASAVCFTKPLKTGRYVGILTTQEENLQLCEVEVYSRGNFSLTLYTKLNKVVKSLFLFRKLTHPRLSCISKHIPVHSYFGCMLSVQTLFMIITSAKSHIEF